MSTMPSSFRQDSDLPQGKTATSGDFINQLGQHTLLQMIDIILYLNE